VSKFKIGNEVKIKENSTSVINGIDLSNKVGIIQLVDNNNMYKVCFKNVLVTNSSSAEYSPWIPERHLCHSKLTVGATVRVSKDFYIPELCSKKAIVLEIGNLDVLVRFNKQHISKLHNGRCSTTICKDKLCWFIKGSNITLLNKPLVNITPFLEEPIVKEPAVPENKVISTTLKITNTYGSFVLNDEEDYAIFDVKYIPQRLVGKTVKLSVEVLD